MVKIAPSILAADFSKLGEEVQDVEQAGADYLHVDVMDGHFVPNISLGPAIVESIHPLTNLPLDVHLMIEGPDLYIPLFIDAGASIISVHQETCVHLHRTIKSIQSMDVKAGVVINPATPISVLEEVLSYVDLVLVMTVNPGFGGQAFIPETLSKVEALATQKENQGLSFLLQVDGGINRNTARQCMNAGADILVAGSSIFNQIDRAKAIQALVGNEQ